MLTQEMIQRINELARKKKTAGLTDEEAAEQKKLYRAYLDNIRENMIPLLDSIEFVEPSKK